MGKQQGRLTPPIIQFRAKALHSSRSIVKHRFSNFSCLLIIFGQFSIKTVKIIFYEGDGKIENSSTFIYPPWFEAWPVHSRVERLSYPLIYDWSVVWFPQCSLINHVMWLNPRSDTYNALIFVYPCVLRWSFEYLRKFKKIFYRHKILLDLGFKLYAHFTCLKYLHTSWEILCKINFYRLEIFFFQKSKD